VNGSRIVPETHPKTIRKHANSTHFELNFTLFVRVDTDNSLFYVPLQEEILARFYPAFSSVGLQAIILLFL
jgi:hypothetical protein